MAGDTRFFKIILFILFSDFVQSTRYIKQKDTSPLQGFSTWQGFSIFIRTIL